MGPGGTAEFMRSVMNLHIACGVAGFVFWAPIAVCEPSKGEASKITNAVAVSLKSMMIVSPLPFLMDAFGPR